MSGHILCSPLVAGLVAGRQTFEFRELGPTELKGLAAPIALCEVLYQREDPAAMLRHTPFVSRVSQIERLKQKLGEVRAGRGTLVVIVGEPGIGKTRTLEEFSETARNQHAVVSRGDATKANGHHPSVRFRKRLRSTREQPNHRR